MADVILKNQDGEDVTYTNVNGVSMRTTDGDNVTFQLPADVTMTKEDGVTTITIVDGSGNEQTAQILDGGSGSVSWNDLSDRPFYKPSIQKDNLTAFFEGTLQREDREWCNASSWDLRLHEAIDKYAKVTFMDNEYYCEITIDRQSNAANFPYMIEVGTDNGFLCQCSDGPQCMITIAGERVDIPEEGAYMKIELLNSSVAKTVDEEFIPDTIVRKRDIWIPSDISHLGGTLSSYQLPDGYGYRYDSYDYKSLDCTLERVPNDDREIYKIVPTWEQTFELQPNTKYNIYLNVSDELQIDMMKKTDEAAEFYYNDYNDDFEVDLYVSPGTTWWMSDVDVDKDGWFLWYNCGPSFGSSPTLHLSSQINDGYVKFDNGLIPEVPLTYDQMPEGYGGDLKCDDSFIHDTEYSYVDIGCNSKTYEGSIDLDSVYRIYEHEDAEEFMYELTAKQEGDIKFIGSLPRTDDAGNFHFDYGNSEYYFCLRDNNDGTVTFIWYSEYVFDYNRIVRRLYKKTRTFEEKFIPSEIARTRDVFTKQEVIDLIKQIKIVTNDAGEVELQYPEI